MKTVKQFALQLSLRGFDLWMDEKNISFGGNYATAILHGIQADVRKEESDDFFDISGIAFEILEENRR